MCSKIEKSEMWTIIFEGGLVVEIFPFNSNRLKDLFISNFWAVRLPYASTPDFFFFFFLLLKNTEIGAIALIW